MPPAKEKQAAALRTVWAKLDEQLRSGRVVVVEVPDRPTEGLLDYLFAQMTVSTHPIEAETVQRLQRLEPVCRAAEILPLQSTEDGAV